MVKITYIEHDGTRHQVDVAPGMTVMEGAVDNGIPGIEAECGGGCACATCHVYVEEPWRDLFPPADATEQDMLSFAPRVGEGSRLGCQLTVTEISDGLVVRMPETQY